VTLHLALFILTVTFM